ncbi:MAG: ABC transporter ATP-binding protein [Clostridia bacterium]|nr:ABC transporter ATP-binding protein [Clostridia bacterium]
MSYIEIKDLTYYYPNTTKPALDKVNLTIDEGDFVLLIGGSGSGKSSLVRALAGLIPQFYGGKYGGEVKIRGNVVCEMDKKQLVGEVGMVFQDPESQLVMNSVEQELVFGMENLGLNNNLMKRRIMEVQGALSLSSIMGANISELSGGQKQKVVLASVLAMQPEILILDEPTSQLDPVAGEEILTIIRRLNEENGITVILVEQRLERCFHLADRFVIMDNGKIAYNGTNGVQTVKWSVAEKSPFIPPLSRVFALAGQKDIPLTVKEGRKIIKPYCIKDGVKNEISKRDNFKGNMTEHKDINCQLLLEIKNVWYEYGDGKEVLKNINMQVHPGDFLAIMGENAAGKTTLLKNIRGLLKPSRGKIKILNKDISKYSVEEFAKTVGYLSQNPNDYLFMPTVREELIFTMDNLGLKDNKIIDDLLEKLQISKYAEVNPRDLSSGERQRVALAAILVASPQVLVLDEPTRGLDYEFKNELGKLLLDIQKQGVAILLVTHDVEFAAEYASEVLLMNQGDIVVEGSREEVLSKSTFYSPQISKLFYGIKEDIVTLAEGEKVLRGMFYNCKCIKQEKMVSKK